MNPPPAGSGTSGSGGTTVDYYSSKGTSGTYVIPDNLIPPKPHPDAVLQGEIVIHSDTNPELNETITLQGQKSEQPSAGTGPVIAPPTQVLPLGAGGTTSTTTNAGTNSTTTTTTQTTNPSANTTKTTVTETTVTKGENTTEFTTNKTTTTISKEAGDPSNVAGGSTDTVKADTKNAAAPEILTETGKASGTVEKLDTDLTVENESATIKTEEKSPESNTATASENAEAETVSTEARKRRLQVPRPRRKLRTIPLTLLRKIITKLPKRLKKKLFARRKWRKPGLRGWDLKSGRKLCLEILICI